MQAFTVLTIEQNGNDIQIIESGDFALLERILPLVVRPVSHISRVSQGFCFQIKSNELLEPKRGSKPKCKFVVFWTFLTFNVKPRPEAHMDMILFEVFLKSIDLIPQQQILQQHYLYYR